MSTKHRHKSKRQNIPQKPDLAITDNQPFDDESETVVDDLKPDDVTSIKHGSGTGISSDEYEISAPVHIPSRDSLGINLVPADLVFRLEEYRSDERSHAALFYTFLGALLGYITSIAITEPFSITIPKISIGVLLVVITLIFLGLMLLFKSRADKKVRDIKAKSVQEE